VTIICTATSATTVRGSSHAVVVISHLKARTAEKSAARLSSQGEVEGVAMRRDEAAAVLGVSPSATLAEARKAFLSRARLIHPDRLSGFPEADQRAATQAMAQLNQAMDVFKSTEYEEDKYEEDEYEEDEYEEDEYEEDEYEEDEYEEGDRSTTHGGSGTQYSTGTTNGNRHASDGVHRWTNRDRIILDAIEGSLRERLTLFSAFTCIVLVYVFRLISQEQLSFDSQPLSIAFLLVCLALIPLGIASGFILVRQGNAKSVRTPWYLPLATGLLGWFFVILVWTSLPSILENFFYFIELIWDSSFPSVIEAIELATRAVLVFAIVPSLIVMPIWALGLFLRRNRLYSK